MNAPFARRSLLGSRTADVNRLVCGCHTRSSETAIRVCLAVARNLVEIDWPIGQRRICRAVNRQRGRLGPQVSPQRESRGHNCGNRDDRSGAMHVAGALRTVITNVAAKPGAQTLSRQPRAAGCAEIRGVHRGRLPTFLHADYSWIGQQRKGLAVQNRRLTPVANSAAPIAYCRNPANSNQGSHN